MATFEAMLSDHREDEVVAALLAQLPAAIKPASVLVPVGEDDCAVVKPLKGKHLQLLKTDCLVEGVHFLSGTVPEDVGWKALCRPLSDIAATGGKPLHALITFAVSPQRSLQWATRVYAGIAEAAAEFGVAVVGGETTSSPGPCFLNVCLTGKVRSDRCVTRGGGKAGDRLYVTGWLGGSFPTGKHLRFRPRLEEAQWLVRHFPVHAMMDLSDGLAADLPRLARASQTGYRVERDRLPLTPGFNISNALGDGEDYELLVAVPPRTGEKLEMQWAKRFSATPLTWIGELRTTDIQEGLRGMKGFDHFNRSDQR